MQFFCFAEGWGEVDWVLWHGCLYFHTGKLSILGTLTCDREHVIQYDTSVEGSLTKKNEGFSCLIEAHLVPSVALSHSTPEQVQLRRQLCILFCLTGIMGISSSATPNMLRYIEVFTLCWQMATLFREFFLTNSRTDSSVISHTSGIFKSQYRQQQVFVSFILRIPPSHMWQ